MDQNISNDLTVSNICVQLIANPDFEPDLELYNALCDAGFPNIRTISLDELVDFFASPVAMDCASCLLINPHAEPSLTPWHPIWDLKSHYLMPVMLYGEPPGDPQHREMYRRLKNLYRSLIPPYSPDSVKKQILEVIGDFHRSRDMYSSNAWLANGSASVDEGLLIVDNNRRIQYVNLAAERILDTSVLRLFNSGIDDVVQLENIEESESRLGGMSLLERADLLCSDGSRIPVEVEQNATYNLRKEPIGTLVVIRDKRSAEQFATSIREASHQEELHARSRSEFISNMSHELRTPLNSILGMAELALELSENPEQQEFLSLLKSSTRNLSTLVTTILDYAKLEARRLTLEYERFQLASLIGKTLEPLISRAQGKNLRVYMEIQPGMRSIYRGDKGRIAQIMENLFQNAVKFTPSGWISCRIHEREAPDATTLTEIRQPMELIIDIEDSGIGIPEDQREKIFEPFYQIDATATRSYGGTGLGLSIAKRLALRMGGDILFCEGGGGGSRFSASIIVNREDSDLLFLNKKLVQDSDEVSDLLPAEIRKRIGHYEWVFIGDDPRWSESMMRWLDFLDLKHQRCDTYAELTRLEITPGIKPVFMHDSRSTWNREAIVFFTQKESRDDTHFSHMVCKTPTSRGLEIWGRSGLDVLYVAEPLQIDEILRPALVATSKRPAGKSESELPPLRKVCIAYGRQQTEIPASIVDLFDSLRSAEIQVRGISDLRLVDDTAAVDLVVSFDTSISPEGLLEPGESLREFTSGIEQLRKRSGHNCPVLVFLDAAFPVQELITREERYRASGFLPVRTVDLSPENYLALLMSFGKRIAEHSDRAHTGVRQDIRQKLEAINSETLSGNFAEVAELAGTLRNYCAERELDLMANDLFRIQLAARREDSEIVFDILNNIRKDIEKMSNIL